MPADTFLRQDTASRRSGRPETYLFFAAVFCAILFLSHAPFLDLPYYWDEAGHFVPSAFDLYREGRWIPVTTTPNVHPPLIKAILAAVWQVTGPSIEVSRSVLLLIAAFGLLGSFLLTIELCRSTRGSPALLAVLFMLASPLFYMQAMLVQLDMPAMAFTAWALFLFLRGRLALCFAACVAAALAKETGALVPGLFFLVAAWERRWKQAALWLLSVVPLLIWLLYLRSQTGHWLGDKEFTDYNVYYPLHPVRFAASLLSRLYVVFLGNFHWIGTLTILYGWRQGLYRTPAWALCGVFVLLHTLSVCILGGAILDRYLLPVMPIFYAAAAAGVTVLAGQLRLIAAAGLVAGMFSGLFWNPPFWPFAQENNLAMVHFVEVHQQAAEFVEARFPHRRIVTAWPLSIELQRPDLGYVTQPLPAVKELPDFRPQAALAVSPPPEVFVLFSRGWDPPASILRDSWLGAIARRYLEYHNPATGLDIERTYGLTRIIRFEQRGQWVEVYARPSTAIAGRRLSSRPSTAAD